MKVTVKGDSLNEAIGNAMIELSTTSDNVAYEVKQEGTEGFLGIGSKPYIIEAYKKDDKEEAYKQKVETKKTDKLVANEKGVYEFKSSNTNNKKYTSKEKTPTNRDEKEIQEKINMFLNPILDKFESKVDIEVKVKKDEGLAIINLKGDNMGVIIGKHGQTLDALQHLANIYVNNGQTDKVRVRMDSENYRDKRYKTLENLAKSVANNVRRTKTNYALEPMPANERRLIHSILQKERNIETESEGRERERHVVVKYKGYR
ncbi:MAG: KH domain-containing protein [Lachnospiraceae bacterium]|nr:KH domain-containing protein [Lachnospiraceae bacterium]